MADWNKNNALKKNRAFGGRDVRDEELNEEDIWGCTEEINEDSRKAKDYHYSSSSSSSSFSLKLLSTTPKVIPEVVGTAKNKETQMMVKQSSAPMNIPDWSIIYGKHNGDGNGDDRDHHEGDKNDDDDDDDDDDDMVPPHEWIAKKLARKQISSFSVCEGIGRTLKGRDLSKVRHAILTKTGFFG